MENKTKINYFLTLKPFLFSITIFLIIILLMFVTGNPSTQLKLMITNFFITILIWGVIGSCFFIFYIRKRKNIVFNKNTHYSLQLLFKIIIRSFIFLFLLLAVFNLFIWSKWGIQRFLKNMITLSIGSVLFVSINLIAMPVYLNFLNLNKKKKGSVINIILLILIAVILSIIFLLMLGFYFNHFPSIYFDLEWYDITTGAVLLIISTILTIIFYISLNQKLKQNE